ncbi:hypothetical protein EVAR_69809_1 [Eumeta japonica]|uniref:Uncharacterized protein n=1 Tax=Eumeta variegata TaxID=151549 RepID=A0A4C1Z7G1_EUMVA|nr:hypothetical protein EVAR_69809_1 [Eumeta japonica]
MSLGAPAAARAAPIAGALNGGYEKPFIEPAIKNSKILATNNAEPRGGRARRAAAGPDEVVIENNASRINSGDLPDLCCAN